MFISVVVPALNEEKYIGQCLSSLRAQTYISELYEIIVVDNGSTDRTSEIARSFGVRVLYEAERGIGRARHRGFQEAGGEIIAGTDADTIVPPTWLEEIARAFRSDELLGAVTGPILLHDGNRLERWYARHVWNRLNRLCDILGRTVISGPNFAVRKRDYWRVGGFDSSLFSAEDMDLGLRLGLVTRTTFNPKMVTYASARRAREGYVKIVLDACQQYVRVVVLRKPPSGKKVVPIR